MTSFEMFHGIDNIHNQLFGIMPMIKTFTNLLRYWFVSYSKCILRLLLLIFISPAGKGCSIGYGYGVIGNKFRIQHDSLEFRLMNFKTIFYEMYSIMFD